MIYNFTNVKMADVHLMLSNNFINSDCTEARSFYHEFFQNVRCLLIQFFFSIFISDF